MKLITLCSCGKAEHPGKELGLQCYGLRTYAVIFDRADTIDGLNRLFIQHRIETSRDLNVAAKSLGISPGRLRRYRVHLGMMPANKNEEAPA